MRRKSTAPRGDTRERLLETAADLIWRRSYHATGVDAICRACGVQKGCFYHHFESKEELTLAAVDLLWEQYRQLMDASFSAAYTPVERFRRFLTASVEAQKAAQKRVGFVCGCPLFALGSEIGTHEPALRERVDEHLEIMTRYFVSAIREGQGDGLMVSGPPRDLAAMVLAYTEGAMTLARIRNDLGPLAGLEDGVFRLLGVRSGRQTVS